MAPAVALVGLLAYLLGYAIYQLFFSPLRKIPGPKLWAISYLPYFRLYTSGQAHRTILKLHQQYGPLVRVGPTHISINHPEAHEIVKGHNKKGENQKDPSHNMAFRNNILGANREDHQRFRRVLSHGFSAQSMLDQEPIIKEYVDKLFEKLHEAAKGGPGPIDVVKWFNYATFDIIGDLSFGEPFGCLDGGTYHPWVALIFQSVKNLSFLTASKRLPWIGPLLNLTIPRNLVTKLAENMTLTREKVRKRLDLGTRRPDFMDAMIRKSETAGSSMTFDELVSNSFILIGAGSETTATALSATTFFLATNPDCLEKLTNEVLSAFASENQINMLSVQKLTYMSAVLNESMRLYPPAPGGQPRMVKEGGIDVLGEFIPEGTTIDIWQWAMYHNPDHWARVEEFIPERWLDDPRFVNDARKAFQPFSIGARNCIGKNLANSEVRLVLARLIWNFEIRPTEDIHKWYHESEVYLLWEKGPVKVYLTPRTR
ncbi:cytochrome P450 [Colletotrichum graminicola M1.001]|uniref:Cytochrome P450 n=1 Tax=Colletotrichum graminicola (strain M1.001 / M2 / FGSC 10212) TaxID=645133 RepID=E3QC38_COLGM|nr:cytochrome P450 [Colletotrichum graminicola M1.001]EFQ28426.1 cytochrome P450 [Colletotrichum graminicola M1.001]